MVRKKKRGYRAKLAICAGVLILSLSGCGTSVENPAEAIKEARVRLEALSSTDNLDAMLDQITTLVNYRYDDKDTSGLDRINQNTLGTIRGRIGDFSGSEYYDVEDLYQKYKSDRIHYIERLGGVVADDGSITYPNGVHATIVKNEYSRRPNIDPDVEVAEGRMTREQAEAYMNGIGYLDEEGNYIGEEDNYVGEETSVEDDSLYSEPDEQELPNAPIEEEELEEIEEIEEYVGGLPPVGEDEEGLPVDENGNYVISMGTSGIDPRAYDIKRYSDGELLWEGVSEDRLGELTNEDNRKFLIAEREAYAGEEIQEKIDKDKKAVEEYESLQEAIKNTPEIEDGMGDEETPILITEDEIPYNINYYYTSTSVIEVDGRHVIPWSDITDNYHKETGRYEYQIFDKYEYVDLATTRIPITAHKGDIRYKFDLKDYRLLDNGQLLLFYESRDEQGEPGFALTITGTVMNGQFIADDILDFTNFYS